MKTNLKSRKNQTKLRVEILERRDLLTSTLYIDFGDRFPNNGSITGATTTQLRQIAGPATNSGPDFGVALPLQLDSFATIYGNGAAAATTRSNIVDQVTRYFDPFDVSVVELTANFQTVNGHNVRGAASIAEAGATLNINNAGSKHNDTYVFVSRFLVNGNNANVLPTGTLLGRAAGRDLPGFNNTDGAVATLLGDTANALSFSSIADTIAHEAGHEFGLRHAYQTNPAIRINIPGTSVNSTIITNSELMSYNSQNSGYVMFSRYPTVAGDANTNFNVLQAVNNTITPSGQFFVDPNIGTSGRFEYVTGTGTNDVISITRLSATQARVDVTAYIDVGYTQPIPLPTPAATGSSTTFSYNISLTRPIRIDAGAGNDRIIINGDLGIAVDLRGMAGVDELQVNAAGATSGSFSAGTNTTPGLDGNPDLRGRITFGGTTVNYREFEGGSSVVVANTANLAFRSSGNADSLTIGSGSAGEGLISGTSNGAPIVPIRFRNVANVALNLDLNEGSGATDFIAVNSIAAAGLSSLSLFTGAGVDFVNINSANSFPVNVDMGGGIDHLQGPSQDTVWNVTGSLSGNLVPPGASSSPISFLNTDTLHGLAANDTFNLSAGALGVAIHAGVGADRITGADAATTWNLTGANAGRSTSANVSFTGIDTINAGAADDLFVLSFGTLNIAVNAGGGNDAIQGPNFTTIWQVTGSKTGNVFSENVPFQNVERLLGGTADDIFALLGSGYFANLHLEGGSGPDTIFGANTANRWDVDATGLGSVNSAANVTFKNIETLTGGNQVDRFYILPGLSSAITVNGGGANPGATDILYIGLLGTKFPKLTLTSSVSGRLTFANRKAVNFNDISKISTETYL